MYKHMGKVVIKILQGSAVTQTVLGGLTIYIFWLQISYSVCAKNYRNWLAVDKCKNYLAYFLGSPCVYFNYN